MRGAGRGRQPPRRAKKQLKKGLEIRADHVEILKKLAHLNKLEENYEQAIEYLQLVLKVRVGTTRPPAANWGTSSNPRASGPRRRSFWAKAIEMEPDGDAAEYAREKLTQSETEEESARDINAEVNLE